MYTKVGQFVVCIVKCFVYMLLKVFLIVQLWWTLS